METKILYIHFLNSDCKTYYSFKKVVSGVFFKKKKHFFDNLAICPIINKRQGHYLVFVKLTLPNQNFIINLHITNNIKI